jgi:hypothetical protein
MVGRLFRPENTSYSDSHSRVTAPLPRTVIPGMPSLRAGQQIFRDLQP